MEFLCWNHFSADLVAARTRWTPCRPHTGNRKSEERELVVAGQRLVWKVRRDILRNHAKLTMFFLPVLLTGIFLMSMIWPEPILGLLVFLPLGGTLTLISGLILWRVYSLRCSAIFDLNRGYSIGTPLHPFSRSHPNSADIQSVNTERPRNGKLTDIYAVQVISKWVRVQIVPKNSYGQNRHMFQNDASQWNREKREGMEVKGIQTYELNIVLKSGTRVNVIDHDDVTAIREEASTLSTFLTVPVWDDSERGFWRFLLTEKLSPKMFWLWTMRRAAPGAWLFLPGKLRGQFGTTPKDWQWELGYAHLLDYVEANGHTRISESDQSHDFFFGSYPLGKWAARQCAEIETLSANQKNRLEILAVSLGELKKKDTVKTASF
jgi:hypothetical protein